MIRLFQVVSGGVELSPGLDSSFNTLQSHTIDIRIPRVYLGVLILLMRVEVVR